MLILLTGAGGRLGREVCQALCDAGMEVRATDQRYVAGLPVRLELADLRDEFSAYRLTQGCDAVVHLANHPNLHVPVSHSTLLVENMAMNAHVFQAALDYKLKAIVFASSVQVMFSKDNQTTPRDPPKVPYLPLDGQLPPNPGRNSYALSKEFAERMLRLMVNHDAALSATALRFPFLIPTPFYERLKGAAETVWSWGLPVDDCFSYLPLVDAAKLVVRVLERQEPGYHQYFPAQCMRVKGQSVEDLVLRYYPEAKLNKSAEKLDSLIDLEALQRDLGWAPSDPAFQIVAPDSQPF